MEDELSQGVLLLLYQDIVTVPLLHKGLSNGAPSITFLHSGNLHVEQSAVVRYQSELLDGETAYDN